MFFLKFMRLATAIRLNKGLDVVSCSSVFFAKSWTKAKSKIKWAIHAPKYYDWGLQKSPFLSCTVTVCSRTKRNLCKICSAFVFFCFFFSYTNNWIDNIQDFLWRRTRYIYPLGEEVWSDTYGVLCEWSSVGKRLPLLTSIVVLLEFYTSVTYLQQNPLMIYKRKSRASQTPIF